MSETSLSICIPTFNRARVLNEALTSIVPQCEALLHDHLIEICISDNASEDQTLKVIEGWKQRFPSIRVNHHEKNLRIDRNIVAAAKLSKCDVIWFLSDDDILEPNAVRDVIAMVDRHPTVPSFIINRREYDATLSTPIGDAHPLMPTSATSNETASSHDEAVYSLDEALVGLGEYLGYLPAWVIRRAAWEQIQPQDFLDTDFVHVGVGLAGSQLWARQNGYAPMMVVSNRPVIRCRLARASWRNRHYEVWIRNWQKTMRELAPYLAKEALNRVNTLVTQRNYLSIVSGRGFGPYGLDDYEKYFKNAELSPLKRAIAFAVALAPRWSASLFTKLQRFVREKI